MLLCSEINRNSVIATRTKFVSTSSVCGNVVFAFARALTEWTPADSGLELAISDCSKAQGEVRR